MVCALETNDIRENVESRGIYVWSQLTTKWLTTWIEVELCARGDRDRESGRGREWEREPLPSRPSDESGLRQHLCSYSIMSYGLLHWRICFVDSLSFSLLFFCVETFTECCVFSLLPFRLVASKEMWVNDNEYEILLMLHSVISEHFFTVRLPRSLFGFVLLAGSLQTNTNNLKRKWVWIDMNCIRNILHFTMIKYKLRRVSTIHSDSIHRSRSPTQ